MGDRYQRAVLLFFAIAVCLALAAFLEICLL